jgi:hypothetical protein
LTTSGGNTPPLVFGMMGNYRVPVPTQKNELTGFDPTRNIDTL